MSQNTLEQIRTFLNAAGVAFREAEHEPTRTSEESAAARGENLNVGAKALLLKTDGVMRLFVLPADRKLDSAAILPFELYADESLGVVTDKVAFNAGSLRNSIIMAASDWERLARPNRFRFAKD